jgi:hypothetical protein
LLAFLLLFFCKIDFEQSWFLADGNSKTVRIPPDPPNKNEAVQNCSNPPEIRQKMEIRQNFFNFLPARQLSNPPEIF